MTPEEFAVSNRADGVAGHHTGTREGHAQGFLLRLITPIYPTIGDFWIEYSLCETMHIKKDTVNLEMNHLNSKWKEQVLAQFMENNAVF